VLHFPTKVSLERTKNPKTSEKISQEYKKVTEEWKVKISNFLLHMENFKLVFSVTQISFKVFISTKVNLLQKVFRSLIGLKPDYHLF